MKEFNEKMSETFLKVLEKCLSSSGSEMKSYVREEIKEFLKSKHTLLEIYDFCDHISKLPMIKLSDKVCIGDISSFVQACFDVTKYYKRPNEI